MITLLVSRRATEKGFEDVTEQPGEVEGNMQMRELRVMCR